MKRFVRALFFGVFCVYFECAQEKRALLLRVFVCRKFVFFPCTNVSRYQFLVLRFFYKIYGKWEKSPSLTLSGCIQKILKRNDALISDVRGRDLSIDAVFL